MAKNDAGKLIVARLTLHPTITFSGDKRPTDSDIASLHHASHAECFIVNSVRTEVVTEIAPPRFV